MMLFIATAILSAAAMMRCRLFSYWLHIIDISPRFATLPPLIERHRYAAAAALPTPLASPPY